ncbi:MAG: hypothetical protein AB7I38_08770 [Dehalococcoidia bacterium]
MRGIKAIVIIGLAAQVLFLVAVGQSTAARFTDGTQTAVNAFSAKTMQTPALIATTSGATVTLDWTNPDALAGANASFIVQRASGDCSAPGEFTALPGSPFTATTLTATDAPAAGGVHCYSVQSALYSWRSQAATAAATLQQSGIPTFRLRSGAPGVCSAAASLQAGAGDGNVVIRRDSSVLFAAPASEGAARVPAGDHVATLSFPGISSSRNVSYTVQLGICRDGVFTSLASESDGFRLDGSGATRILTLRVANEVALPSGTYLAVRITNERSQNLRLNGPNGQSTLEAPAGAGY